MDTSLFIRLLSNLLSVSSMCLTDPNRELKAFEEKNCLVPSLQPMFTAEAIGFLLPVIAPATVYEIQDKLGICITFFQFQENTYLIGPYVQYEYQDKQIEQLLVENQLPASLVLSINLYYTSLPLVYTNQIQNVITALTRSFDPSISSYTFRRLNGFIQSMENTDRTDTPRDPCDYSEIYKRYDAEHRFLHMIASGDIENIASAHNEMEQSALSSGFYQSASYINPLVGFTILRVLARKAAEEGGLSIITINEITQRYVQMMDAATTQNDSAHYIHEMVLELTKAVHEHKLQGQNYPKLISDTMEYLYLHLGEEIRLQELSQIVHVSPSYLSKYFRQVTGMTISQYLTIERCKKAAELLSSSEYQIQEISSVVGYSDNNYFVKVFRKIYGQTPSEYRKELLSGTAGT